MEKIIIFVERIMANKTYETILVLIAVMAPLDFLKILYAVWFGPMEVFVGFESEKTTWLVLAIIDAVGFITTLPARKKGRVIQIVMGLWVIEMFLVYLATILR